MLQTKRLTYKEKIKLLFSFDIRFFIEKYKYSYLFIILPFLLLYLFITPTRFAVDMEEHYLKSYYVSNGNFFMENQIGKNTGGQIDKNYFEFVHNLYYYNIKDKNIKFSKNTQYKEFTGASIYPFLLYTPNAIAIKIGQILDLTIHNTVYLMKTFSTIIFLAIMFYTFSILKIGKELFLFVSILPTTIIQATTGVIEGYVIAISILMITLFFNTLIDGKLTTKRILTYYILSIIIITVKPNFFPFLFFYLYFLTHTQKKTNIFIFTLSLIIILTWFYFSSKYNIDMRGIGRKIDIPTSTIIIDSLLNPLDFFNKLFSTLTNINHTISMLFYGSISLGAMGKHFFLQTENGLTLEYNYLEYFNYYLPIYFIIFYFLYITIKATGNDKETIINVIKITKKEKYILLFFIYSSILLVFYLLYIFWPQTQNYIVGLHGRYFVPYIFILFTFLFFDSQKNNSIYKEKFWNYYILYYIIIFGLTTYSILNIYELNEFKNVVK
jgi:uncharacterized membrane protein